MSSAIDRFMVLSNSQFDNYTIIYPTFAIAFAQMIIILILLFETPFRNPLVVQLDHFKRGRPQLVVISVGTTVFVLMVYNIYSVLEIRRRSNAVNSPNHVILVNHMFDAYLMGFSLFLLVALHSLHRYIKELVIVTETIRVAKKDNRAYEDFMKKSADEAEIIRNEISRLRTEITNLESECSRKEKAVKLLRDDSSELKNKLEGLFEEYDRLLAYNKDLKEQLQGVNERLSHSDGMVSAFFSWDRWGL